MRSGLLPLIGLGLRRDRRGALLSCFGIAAGVGSVLFFLAAGMGVESLVKSRILPVDASLVEVVPPKVSVGLFGKVEIDEAMVGRLAALEGAEAAYRKMQVRVPAVSRYDGSFFGQRLRMGLEIVAEGVDPALLEEDLGDSPFADGGEGAIPFVASPRLLEIYNKSFARMRGLPQLTPSLLAGFEMPLELGRSFVSGRGAEGRSRQASARLVGFSHRSMLQGITIPLETARRLNGEFGRDARTYSSVVLRARDPGGVPGLIEEVRGMGLEIDDAERQLAQRVGAVVAVVTAVLSLFGLLICVLSSVNIALSLGASVRSRSREIGILRAVGATSRDVAALVLGEASILGLAGGAAGCLAAWGLARGVDALASSWLPDFPFKPETFFAFPPWLLLLGLAVGIASAGIGALPPMSHAIRQDPARVIG